MHVWFVPPSRFAFFLSAREYCTCQLTPHVVYDCLDTARCCCFPRENVCQPSALQSKLRSITAESVANGDRWVGNSTSLGINVETPQISIGHELSHTTVGILAVGLRRNLVEDSVSSNRVTSQTNTQRVSVARDVLFACVTFPGTLPR